MKHKRSLVSIGAENLDECVTFYKHLLGCPPQIYQAPIYAEFQLAGLVLSIFKPRLGQENEFSNPTKGRSGGLSICLEVEDLETAVIHLTELGCSIETEFTSGSTLKELYIYDPAGNRIILYQYSNLT